MVVVLDASRERGRIGPQPHDERGAEGGQHHVVAPLQRLQHRLRLEMPVRRLAALLPELADRLAGARLNGEIDVDEWPSRGGGDEGADGGLAGAHQADDHHRRHEPTRNAWRARL